VGKGRYIIIYYIKPQKFITDDEDIGEGRKQVVTSW
jgi:hypothetical protein